MKKLILTIALAVSCLTGYSQAPEASTNSTTVPEFLGTAWNFAIGQGITNLGVTTYGTYTPALEKWGGGLVITRNIPIGDALATGIGIGLDYYDHQFYALSGQVSLQANLRPFANWGTFGEKIVITPFTYIGLGTPFGDNANNTGNLETIAAGGMALHVAKVLGGSLSINGIYGTREGLGDASGSFYGGGLTLFWKF